MTPGAAIRQYLTAPQSAQSSLRIPRQESPYRLLAVHATIDNPTPATITPYLAVEWAGVTNLCELIQGTTNVPSLVLDWMPLLSNRSDLDPTGLIQFFTTPAPPWIITPQMDIALECLGADAATAWGSVSWLIEYL